MPITHSQILHTAASSDKRRFAISSDTMRIRANQGHSFPVDLGLVPKMPPEMLFHGTAEKALEAVLAEGLKPMARQHVHLSQDRETALTVGQRHGPPVVLRIAAGEMAAAGQVFYLSENGVWLTGPVAPQYLARED